MKWKVVRCLRFYVDFLWSWSGTRFFSFSFIFVSISSSRDERLLISETPNSQPHEPRKPVGHSFFMFRLTLAFIKQQKWNVYTEVQGVQRVYSGLARSNYLFPIQKVTLKKNRVKIQQSRISTDTGKGITDWLRFSPKRVLCRMPHLEWIESLILTGIVEYRYFLWLILMVQTFWSNTRINVSVLPRRSCRVAKRRGIFFLFLHK